MNDENLSWEDLGGRSGEMLNVDSIYMCVCVCTSNVGVCIYVERGQSLVCVYL